MTTELATVQYVTSHFKALQGLRIVPFGLFFLMGALGSLAWTPWSGFMTAGIREDSLIIAAAMFLLYGLISVYYRRRFGTVVPEEKSDKQIRRAAALWGVFVVALIIDFYYRWPVNFMMLSLAACFAFAGFDGSRRYGQILLGAVCAVWAVFPLLLGRNESTPYEAVFGIPFAAWYGIVGITFVLVGIADHLLLVRTLRTTRQWQE
jgi:hypothetical protein